MTKTLPVGFAATPPKEGNQYQEDSVQVPLWKRGKVAA
jgi:hypothetical protein